MGNVFAQPVKDRYGHGGLIWYGCHKKCMRIGMSGEIGKSFVNKKGLLQEFIRVMTSSLDCLDCNYVQQSEIWRGRKSEKLDPRNQRTVAMMSSILRILLTVSEANVMAERVTCKGCTTSSS
ncbi:unnamed protein product, partial [Oppiella nova]